MPRLLAPRLVAGVALLAMSLPAVSAQETGALPPIEGGAYRVVSVPPCGAILSICQVPGSSVTAYAAWSLTPGTTSSHGRPTAAASASAIVAGNSAGTAGIVLGPFPPPPGCGVNCEPATYIAWVDRTVQAVRVVGPFPPPPGCGVNCQPDEIVQWGKDTIQSIRLDTGPAEVCVACQLPRAPGPVDVPRDVLP